VAPASLCSFYTLTSHPPGAGFEQAKIKAYEAQAMQKAASRSMSFHEQARPKSTPATPSPRLPWHPGDHRQRSASRPLALPPSCRPPSCSSMLAAYPAHWSQGESRIASEPLRHCRTGQKENGRVEGWMSCATLCPVCARRLTLFCKISPSTGLDGPRSLVQLGRHLWLRGA
jgi:hypothetical protein